MPEYADILQNRKKHLEHIRMLEAEHDRKIESMERVRVDLNIEICEQDDGTRLELQKRDIEKKLVH